MKKIIIAALLLLSTALCAREGMEWEAVDHPNREEFNLPNAPKGYTLYLIRFGVETKRAVFAYEGDCLWIASIMQEREPNVKWHCK